MAGLPKSSSSLDYHGGKKIQITPSNTAHMAPLRAAGMQQRAPKVSVNNLLDISNFPPLSGAVVIPKAIHSQIPQRKTAGAVDPLEATFAYAVVLRRSAGLQVTEGSEYMPREVAEGMQCNARRVMMNAAPVVVEKFEALPEELMDTMGEMSVPGRINLASSETVLVPGHFPSFMSSVVRLFSTTRRLKYIQTVLRNSVLETTSLRDLSILKTWLASINFKPLQSNLQNGFDAVRALSFSDINRTAALISDQTWPAPSTWANDLELAQRCKDLCYVEVDVSLSDRFLFAIQEAYNMEEAMEIMEAMKQEGEDDSQTYQLTRFLELEGLNVLRLRFFTEGWNMTTLDDGNMRMIASWLEGEFTARQQSVEVKFFGWSE